MALKVQASCADGRGTSLPRVAWPRSRPAASWRVRVLKLFRHWLQLLSPRPRKVRKDQVQVRSGLWSAQLGSCFVVFLLRLFTDGLINSAMLRFPSASVHEFFTHLDQGRTPDTMCSGGFWHHGQSQQMTDSAGCWRSCLHGHPSLQKLHRICHGFVGNQDSQLSQSSNRKKYYLFIPLFSLLYSFLTNLVRKLLITVHVDSLACTSCIQRAGRYVHHDTIYLTVGACWLGQRTHFYGKDITTAPPQHYQEGDPLPPLPPLESTPEPTFF
jgi:hypothetical protein